jgi:hypothetical protein
MRQLFVVLFQGFLYFSSPQPRSIAWSLVWLVFVAFLAKLNHGLRSYEFQIWFFSYAANFVLDVVLSSMILAEKNGRLHPYQIKIQDTILKFCIVPKTIVSISSFVCFWIIAIKFFI